MSYKKFTSAQGTEIKAWIKGVEFDANAKEQVFNIASMHFVKPHVAIMPDVHWGMGATIGSVIPTVTAIIPAAVGVDIGCGMMAVKTSLTALDLPDNLSPLRFEIEKGCLMVGLTMADRVIEALGMMCLMVRILILQGYKNCCEASLSITSSQKSRSSYRHFGNRESLHRDLS